MFKFGDVILAQVQFTDTAQIKLRPAVVLFEDHGNIVIVGITSNTAMAGIPLTKKEGAVVESIIKMNYIFTISTMMVKRTLFMVSEQKKILIKNYLQEKLR